MDDSHLDPTQLENTIEESLLLDDSTLTSSAKVRGASYDVIPPQFSSPGLSEIARYGGYGTYSGQSNTDAWVRVALKNFDRNVYDDVYGFTRKPEGTPGMYKSLFKFAEGRSDFHSLNRVQRKAMQAAISKTKKRFRLPYKSDPLDWHHIGQFLRRDTSAGATFMGCKKGEVMEDIYHEARWLAHRMKQDGSQRFNPKQMRFPPCLAGQRGGMSEASDPKTRLVWIYPAEMLVVEGQYAPTMYHKFMADPNTPMLNGRSSTRLYTDWINDAKEGDKLYGLDFSSFDSKVPAWLIRVAFNILRQNINFETWNGQPVSKRDRQKWRNVWDAMVHYFINTPILMPDGRMFRKYRGVPSGSWWTQMVDSVVNDILVQYICLCQEIEPKDLRVLGDDSAFRSYADLDLDQAARDAGDVNMVMHPEKCDVSTDPTKMKLLGTTYRNGHVHRDTDEWFKLVLYPESSVRTIDVSFSRLIGLWIGGAMFDTKFCQFMDYYQTCFKCPEDGWFSKEQRRWLEVVYGNRAPRGWSTKKSLFWRSIFYAYA
nr:RNA-dependent RNA polymerase [Aspergillus ochraceopetaliformis partitivirus 1]WRU22293.1 RNA-dependent RNA polymerase [Aspergillus ochraceopetaliformis partitivirus 1]